jgi:hypothetical protein
LRRWLGIHRINSGEKRAYKDDDKKSLHLKKSLFRRQFARLKQSNAGQTNAEAILS